MNYCLEVLGKDGPHAILKSVKPGASVVFASEPYQSPPDFLAIKCFTPFFMVSDAFGNTLITWYFKNIIEEAWSR